MAFPSPMMTDPMTRPFVQTTKYLHYLDANGDIAESVPFVPDGRGIAVHDTGFVAVEAAFAGGKRNGPTVHYAPDGLIQADTPYRDGDREGVARYYTPEGRIAVLEKFSADTCLEQRQYHANGKRKMRTLYTDNRPDGPQGHYDETGKLVRETMWQKGVRLSETPIVDGLYEGTQTLYDEKQQVAAEYIWQAGKREGVAVDYGPDGLYFEQMFKNDRKIGPRVGLDATGRINSREYPDHLESYHDNDTKTITPLNKKGEMSGLEHNVNIFSGAAMETGFFFIADRPSDVLEPTNVPGKRTDIQGPPALSVNITNPDAVEDFMKNMPRKRVGKPVQLGSIPDTFSKN